MKTEFVPPIEIERQRSAWFKQHAKREMIVDEFIRLNGEALHAFPPTEEERRQKTEDLMAMPEFVL